MAAANANRGYKIRFELSLAGLLGVGVVCFCIFVWMFLLGVWAGQSGLISGIAVSPPTAIPNVAKVATKNKLPEPPEDSPEPAPLAVPGQAVVAPVQSPESVEPPAQLAAKVAQPAAPAEPPQSEAPQLSAYAIQVGAYRDQRYVEEALQKWHARGYEVFFRSPSGPNEHLTKVYLGHFLDAEAARKEAEVLVSREGITPIIVTIPAETAKRP